MALGFAEPAVFLGVHGDSASPSRPPCTGGRHGIDDNGAGTHKQRMSMRKLISAATICCGNPISG
jgi:hypothetical protein